MAFLLKGWSLDLVAPNVPIVSDPKSLLNMVGDEEYFPGFDTLWLIERTDKVFHYPSFTTWLAARDINDRPWDKTTKLPVDWSVVAQWMVQVGAVVGLSHSYFTLEITLR